MTPERWARIKQVFEAALDAPEEDRAAVVDRKCGSDDDLRREVESLLRESQTYSPTVRPAELSPGTRLGPYEILGPVGAGGMGTVYKARDTRLGRFVAIKMVREASSARFQREARAVAELSHPHICSLHDVGPNYLVMEYLEGKTLAARLGEGRLRNDEFLDYARQIAGALDAAHAHRIVHRDLKPGNILLTDSGAKVLDFGLAKKVDGDTVVSMEGTLAGTLAYMSPEQVEGKPVDARSDIFSFGAVLYEMATGRPAFQADSNAGIIAAVLRAEPPLDGIDPALCTVIQGCLRKDRTARFQSAREVGTALQQLGVRSLPPRRSRAHWIWAAAALVMVAAAALIWRGFSPAPPRDLVAVPLTGLPGLAFHPSFSPDGEKVAFSWNGERGANWDIYIKQVGSAGQLRLTTNPQAETAPAWAPDDRYIAFTRADRDGVFSLMVIPPLGGPERKIADIIASASVDLCWTPDSRWLAVAGQGSSNEASAIWFYEVDTGERRRLTRSSNPADNDFQPSISPDGHWLAFSRGNRSGYSVRPYVQRLSPEWRTLGDPRRLTANLFYYTSGIAWSPDARSVIYSAGTELRLWRIPLMGHRPPSMLNFAAAESLYPAISGTKSHRMVYTWLVRNTNLWRMDMQTGGRQPLIMSHGVQILPQYSPDGRKIAIESNRSGVTQVYTCDADGANCVQLTFGDHPNGRPRWSPDGRWLCMGSDIGGVYQVYVMPADGGTPRPLTSGQENKGIASWSHDGRSIYFNSPAAADAEIWKVPSSGGTPLRVTHGRRPIASVDGKYLYFLKAEPNGPLVRMPVEGGAEEEVAPVLSAPDMWVLARDGVYFVAPGDPPTLRIKDFATGRIRILANFDGSTGGLAVSPDGMHVVYARQDHVEAGLMLVDQFR